MADPASTPSTDAPALADAQNVEPLPTASATAEKSGTAILAIKTPFTTSRFVSGVDGWAPVTPAGTSGPSASADAVIAAAESCGLTLERR